MRVDAGFPLLIDRAMTLPAGFGPQAVDAFRYFLERNGMRVVGAQSEDDDRFDLGVIDIHDRGGPDHDEQDCSCTLHAANNAERWLSTDAANAGR